MTPRWSRRPAAPGRTRRCSPCPRATTPRSAPAGNASLPASASVWPWPARGDPALLVLDEPNANLDAEGERALVAAIRAARGRGRTVVVMAHRPSAIAACDLLLMLDRGRQVDFGPRDEVLRRRTRNYPQLVRADGDAPAAAERPA